MTKLNKFIIILALYLVSLGSSSLQCIVGQNQKYSVYMISFIHMFIWLYQKENLVNAETSIYITKRLPGRLALPFSLYISWVAEEIQIKSSLPFSTSLKL